MFFTQFLSLLVKTDVWKLQKMTEYWHFIPSSLHTTTSISDIISKCLANLNQNRPSKVLTHADDMLTYKTSRDTQKVAKAVQQQDNVFQWYHDTKSLINPNKPVQTLQCTQSSRQCDASSHLMELQSNNPSETPSDT